MELEKVLRIIATFIALATFAIWIATELLFPDAWPVRIPLLIAMIYGLGRVWKGTPCEKQTQLPK